MKQSAVGWLAEQMEHSHIFKQLVEQAKEMEKQQIEDAWNDGYNRYSGIGDSDTYYETLIK